MLQLEAQGDVHVGLWIRLAGIGNLFVAGAGYRLESDACVFVQGGKGKKDRYTILSNECLCVLREYWSVYRPKHSKGWLFLGMRKQTHLTSDSASKAFRLLLIRAGITKDVSIHTMRHCFATHLLEDGVDIFRIKELLGHASLSSTTIYLHLANTTAGVTSPADNMPYHG